MPSQWEQNTKAAQDFYGKTQPGPPDFTGAAKDQARQTAMANRPNQQGPFGSTEWSQDPATGQWTQRQNFTGPYAGIADSLGGQAKDAMSAPLDFSGLPALDYGEGAFQKATDAAFGQARSRLDPLFAQQGEALDAKLAAQGLAPDSEAGRNSLRQFGEGRTDAYNQALFSALREGRGAAEGVFRQSQAARQQGLAEMLRKRGGPMAELAQLSNLNRQPSFMPVQGPNLLGAAGMDWQALMDKRNADNEASADMFGGIGNILKFLAFL